MPKIINSEKWELGESDHQILMVLQMYVVHFVTVTFKTSSEITSGTWHSDWINIILNKNIFLSRNRRFLSEIILEYIFLEK